MTLPAADDLFRRTEKQTHDEPDQTRQRLDTPTPADAHDAHEAHDTRARRPSGRVRHDEKMTVYVTADELLDIEHARLELRRHHGLAVDRGRLVREAIAMALADLDHGGEESALVRRLTTG